MYFIMVYSINNNLKDSGSLPASAGFGNGMTVFDRVNGFGRLH